MPDQNAFQNQVLPAELAEIKRRRESLGQDSRACDPEVARRGPSVERGLVGMAISGGGIRSATFSLGAIQSLTRGGLFKRVDYLSTVSGGGYTGSCLSSLLNDPAQRADGDGFALNSRVPGGAESAALTHLRNGSNYLRDGGLLGLLRIPNLVLRGLLLNLFALLPFIMLAVMLTELLYETLPDWDALPSLALPLVLLFLVMAVGFPFALRIFRRRFDWRARNRYELLLTVPLLLASALLLAVPLLHITRMAIEHSGAQVLAWLDTFAAADVWRSGVGLLGLIALLMLAGRASRSASQLGTRLLLGLFALLGPVIVFGIYLLLCLWQIDSPVLPYGSADVLDQAAACDGPCLTPQDDAAELTPAEGLRTFMASLVGPERAPADLAELSAELEGRTLPVDATTVVSCTPAPCRELAPPTDWRDDPRVWVIGPAQVDGVASALAGCATLSKAEVLAGKAAQQPCHYIVRGSERYLHLTGSGLDLFDGPQDTLFLVCLLVFLLLNRYLLDVNLTGPHGFYRDRLSRVYLFRCKRDGTVEANDGELLSALNQPGSAAPYHLINTALNLQGHREADLRGRNADFFVFSKCYSGCTRTGYARTSDLEDCDPHLNLGTALAISGAAAAPNMGRLNNRALTFIMTLLNIRLGYWLPNPAWVNRGGRQQVLRNARPALIWKEATGRLHARASHVNLSDGGHLENLGIYSLLQRRCRFIVALDGEADPDLSFGGLVALMRFARIDLGVSIDIDLEPLRLRTDGTSRQRWALGTIDYGAGETGYLLYLKSSVDGSEPEYLRAYRADHPCYPHESTADQFFNEEQFEAYRALGQAIADEVMERLPGLEGFSELIEARASAPKAGNDSEYTSSCENDRVELAPMSL